MLRVKDPKVSLEFYTGVLGMRLLTKLDFPDMKFTLYFLGYENSQNMPDDPKERVSQTAAVQYQTQLVRLHTLASTRAQMGGGFARKALFLCYKQCEAEGSNIQEKLLWLAALPLAGGPFCVCNIMHLHHSACRRNGCSPGLPSLS